MPDAAEMIPAYAAAGLAVLPLAPAPGGTCTCWKGARCEHPGKHPLTKAVPHGKDDATTDLGQIAEWLAEYPGCNWGARPAVGSVVIDVDPRNGGATTLVELQRRHGLLPSTLSARTGSGGLHIWLSYNGPARGKLGTGIDVKSNSGYVVVPPSVHACGGTYEWINQAPAAYAPQWVKSILNPPIRRRGGGAPTQTADDFLMGRSRIDPLITFVATAPEGERNNRLYWAACRALDGGLDTAPLVDAAASAGLTTTAAQATVESAVDRGPRKVA